MKSPEPGIYPNVPMSEYHAWEAASNSRLSQLLRSPAHLKSYIDRPKPDTDAQVIGRATHAAILEPESFEKQYKKGPLGDRRTKKVKEQWEALVAEAGAENILRPADYEACLAMRESVWKKTTATGLIGGKGQRELSIIWMHTDALTLCKARLDRLSPALDGGTIIDLKTTTDASPLKFERTIFAYGYHRQGALYVDGARAVGIPIRHYAIIAIEKEPPYEVAVYRLMEGAIEAGRDEVARLLPVYKRCVEENNWPGYPDEIRDITLPIWAWAASEYQAEVL